MSSAADAITVANNYTAISTAASDTVTGAASANLSSTDFLNLLLEQLQYQDPMEPTGNSEFITQQCQFAQLEATDTMSENIAENNAIMQATSLVGQSVTLTDPNDTTKTITGKVTSAEINGDSSAIVVNGTAYPLSTLKYVNSESTTTGSTTTTGATTTTTTGTTTSTS